MGVIYQTSELCWIHTRVQLENTILQKFVSINDPPFGNGWSPWQFNSFLDSQSQSRMFFYATNTRNPHDIAAFGAIEVTRYWVTVHNYGINVRFRTREKIQKLCEMLEEIRPCHEENHIYLRGLIIRVWSPTQKTSASLDQLGFSPLKQDGEVVEMYK